MSQTKQTYKSSSLVTEAEEHAPLANEDAVILGTNVEHLRDEAGFNISEFAREANVTRPFIYKVESGLSNPRLSDMQKLARALGVHVVDLLMPPKDS